MASITKTSTGWRAQIKLKGMRDSRMFDTKAEAAAWSAKRETEFQSIEAGMGSKVTWKNAICFPWILPPAGSPMRIAVELELARAGLPLPGMVLESSSLSINAMVVRNTDCLFVASSQSARFAPEPKTLRALPSHLASVPKAIGLLYAMPSKGAVDTLRHALQEAARTLPGIPWQRTGS